MRLTPYEKNVQREIDKWHSSEASMVMQALNWATKPLDWVVERVSPDLVDQVSDAIGQVLAKLGDASKWTFDAEDVLKAARARGLAVERLEDLRGQDLEALDGLARSFFSQNALLAAIEGGGTGLGGAALIVADIPLLFTINFRLIQQIAGAYGFALQDPSFHPILLMVFNVAASGSRDAKHEALREISVAAAAIANGLAYRGRVTGTLRDQNRHLPREIAKSIVGHKLGQLIPIAGAAVGAGINYWFTLQSAESAFMLCRALFLEVKERV